MPFKLIYDEEMPPINGKGQRNPEYDQVIAQFLESGKKTAKVDFGSKSAKGAITSLKARLKKHKNIEVHSIQKNIWLINKKVK